jgi:hypothetical protein
MHQSVVWPSWGGGGGGGGGITGVPTRFDKYPFPLGQEFN